MPLTVIASCGHPVTLADHNAWAARLYEQTAICYDCSINLDAARRAAPCPPHIWCQECGRCEKCGHKE